MPDRGHQIAVASGFDAQYAKAVFLIVKCDPLHQAGQDLGRVFRSSGHEPSDHSPDRFVADLKQARDLGDWALLHVPHTAHLRLLSGCQSRRATPDTAALAGGLKPLLGSLHDPFALELGDRCENVRIPTHPIRCSDDI